MIIILFKPITQSLLALFMKRLMSERYPANIWEMVTALTRTSPIKVIENSLRAASGAIIERPFGSPRKFLNFDGLTFVPAQLAVLPAHEEEDVELRVTIGPKAKKPLTLDIPILAGAIGYGIGVSEKVKIALAKGTAAVGTATNTGEGGFLPEDRHHAKFLIIQYSSGHWSKEPSILRQADAIEIHIGQGATVGAASIIPPEFMQGKARDIMKVKPGELVVIPSRHKEINHPQDLAPLVEQLRGTTGGVPIGVKICASARMEADLEVAIQARVDFISIDGSQAGTKGGPPILEDDFGLPTLFALSRAVRYLKKRGVKEQISLLIGGGFSNPGECLKALALGADGVYMGTSLLWAMTHDQVTKAIPWEPPTQLTFYPGSLVDQFDENKAAQHLQNFFTSFVEEIKLAIRAMGKDNLQAVDTNDLASLDKWTSQVTGVPLASEPYDPGPVWDPDGAGPSDTASTSAQFPVRDAPAPKGKNWFEYLKKK
nr:FMN-binding glutamate synthase family protein [Paenibacillus sp. J2TS4]